MSRLTSLEICAGAGGQALGLERAGFDHIALVENDSWARETLLFNRPQWPVLQRDGTDGVSFDLTRFSARKYRGDVDLLAGGVPCPPFSVAGKQLGRDDDRDMFPHALRLVRECDPRAVMLENVKGLLHPAFAEYRREIIRDLEELGYVAEWRLLNASDYGVPQLRPRAVLVAVKAEDFPGFEWPEPKPQVVTVGNALEMQMAANGWLGAKAWAAGADRVAPTLVGGSKRHGGPDLGPTRARQAWLRLGVDGTSLANDAPETNFVGIPKLTAQMAATIQGFPLDWTIRGRKTAAYRQVGNAFPPPVAEAVGRTIATALKRRRVYEQKAIGIFQHRDIVDATLILAD